MNNIKVKTRIIAVFAVIAAMFFVFGFYSEGNVDKIYARDKAIYDTGIVPLADLQDASESMLKLRIAVRDWRLSNNDAKRKAVLDKGMVHQKEVEEIIKQQYDLTSNEGVKQKFRDLEAAIKKYETEAFAYFGSASHFDSDTGMNTDEFPESMNKAGADMEEAMEEAIHAKVHAIEGFQKDNEALWKEVGVVSKIVIAVVVLFCILIGTYLTLSITHPLNVVVTELSKIEKGDMTVRIDLKRGDEFGVLGKAADSLASNFQRVFKNLHHDSDSVATTSEELSSVSRQMASGAEETVAQSTTVASTTEQMSVNINAMASAAEQASVNANEVAGAAEQMSANMNTIAAAMEEMSASINQIAGNTSEVREIASEATGKAADATTVMNKLGTAAKEIGQVTDVIKKIADKTNLLALNATIEAASAGESGKGFAVVAGEIKELANQSATSADDIAHRIDDIQRETNEAVTVISGVSEIISKINQSVADIAGYVSQQTKASNEIASNVSQANTGAKRVASAISEVAKGTNDVSRNAGETAKGAHNVSSNAVSMNQVAKESAQGATQVNQSAAELARIASELKQVINKFKIS